MEADLSGFNIDEPCWDQCTFLGRVKHFFNITDPRTVLVPERELDWAKVMVEKSRMGVVPPGTQVEQLLYAKKLYDSAFHPDTGEKMNVIGRMSFQVPGGMIITGFMLQFYRTMPAVIFWQWVNQSFNALVNYTNRNAASPTSLRQMALSYITATTTAVATAVGMNMLTKVLSGAAGGMVASRGQQSPRENIPQAWRCRPCLGESGMARAQPARGQYPQVSFSRVFEGIWVPRPSVWINGAVPSSDLFCSPSAPSAPIFRCEPCCSLPPTESSTPGGPLGALCRCGCC
ncbi:sideroflexin-2 isoform X2 [Mustela putorius furo]|uniref:Sideroflexin-2 isoform X2 n=1 Tax=Mustela putorius furo TaxID=9669 RepID=A0A8U0UQJ7_MUSPF|nr:sideroflexin-2 isoform X2 [Mustela putorius furo]XP_044924390.1 sideroflexin-2 isoform X2 [Mustela putorius furo]